MSWDDLFYIPDVSSAGSSSDSFNLFDLTLSWAPSDDGRLTVSLSLFPSDDLPESYVILVDVKLTIGKDEYVIDRDPWPAPSPVLSRLADAGPIRLSIRTGDVLTKINLEEPSAYRNFQILCGYKSWYVDCARLSQLGGKLFSEWEKSAQETNSKRVVVHEDETELGCLLEAVAGYDHILIHRRNYKQLLPICEKHKVHTVVREIEEYLRQSHIHPIQLLEMGVQLRMARLYEYTLRTLGPPSKAIETLHKYLRDTNCTLNDLHPKLRSAFQIVDRTIVIA